MQITTRDQYARKGASERFRGRHQDVCILHLHPVAIVLSHVDTPMQNHETISVMRIYQCTHRARRTSACLKADVVKFLCGYRKRLGCRGAPPDTSTRVQIAHVVESPLAVRMLLEVRRRYLLIRCRWMAVH